MKAMPKQAVSDFNRRFAVGAEVDYCEVVGLTPPVRYRTRSEAEVLSGHTAVVWLEGKSGCVCCDHCFVPGSAPPLQQP